MNEIGIISSLQSGNILMLLGIILFVILAIALIVMLIRKQNVAVLLPFFILSILMIGFTQIAKFTGFGFEVDTLQEETRTVENNPSDQAAKKKLRVTLQKAEKSVTANNSSADVAESIAAANIALGQPDKALPWASVAVKKAPSSPTAKLLLQKSRALQPQPEATKGSNP